MRKLGHVHTGGAGFGQAQNRSRFSRIYFPVSLVLIHASQNKTDTHLDNLQQSLAAQTEAAG